MPKFQGDPRAFIRHNLLTLDPKLDDPDPDLMDFSVVWVTLEDITNTFELAPTRNRNRKGLARRIATVNNTWQTTCAQVYKIIPADRNDQDAFKAYICPYAANTTNTKFLNSHADYMFTGNMNGCTFGIGIPNPSGEVRVGHTNAQMEALPGKGWNDADFGPQRSAQRKAMEQKSLTAGIVDPDAYRDNAPPGEEFEAVTIGLRINGAWEFWYQQQLVNGSVSKKKVATTRVC